MLKTYTKPYLCPGVMHYIEDNKPGIIYKCSHCGLENTTGEHCGKTYIEKFEEDNEVLKIYKWEGYDFVFFCVAKNLQEAKTIIFEQLDRDYYLEIEDDFPKIFEIEKFNNYIKTNYE